MSAIKRSLFGKKKGGSSSSQVPKAPPPDHLPPSYSTRPPKSHRITEIDSEDDEPEQASFSAEASETEEERQPSRPRRGGRGRFEEDARQPARPQREGRNYFEEEDEAEAVRPSTKPKGKGRSMREDSQAMVPYHGGNRNDEEHGEGADDYIDNHHGGRQRGISNAAKSYGHRQEEKEEMLVVPRFKPYDFRDMASTQVPGKICKIFGVSYPQIQIWCETGKIRKDGDDVWPNIDKIFPLYDPTKKAQWDDYIESLKHLEKKVLKAEAEGSREYAELAPWELNPWCDICMYRQRECRHCRCYRLRDIIP
ncbi:hypothetical protein MMC20_007467 [Loxospora ochrophaea]|nr:hypothetical protein [Loxospora ochrophaea]